MKYKKGQSGNPKGKPKGAENKVAKELKEIIKEVLEKEFEIIDKTLQTLEPEKRLEIILKLLPYVVPKLQNTQFDITGNNINEPTTIKFVKFNEPELTKEEKEKILASL